MAHSWMQGTPKRFDAPSLKGSDSLKNLYPVARSRKAVASLGRPLLSPNGELQAPCTYDVVGAGVA